MHRSGPETRKKFNTFDSKVIHHFGDCHNSWCNLHLAQISHTAKLTHGENHLTVNCTTWLSELAEGGTEWASWLWTLSSSSSSSSLSASAAIFSVNDRLMSRLLLATAVSDDDEGDCSHASIIISLSTVSTALASAAVHAGCLALTMTECYVWFRLLGTHPPTQNTVGFIG